MDKIKALLDELAAVVAEMEAMTEDAPEGEEAAPMTEEQEASLRSLEAKADKLRERVEFLQRVQAKEAELRAVLERSAPAKAIEAPETKEPAVEKREYAVPKSHGKLVAFRSSEDAYRAGMHIKGFVFGDEAARRWCRDHGVESRAQASGVNSLGGVLVAPEMASEIIRLVEQYGAFPQYARRVQMNSDTLVIARRTGGLAARPVGENVEVTQSDVTFDNVELNAKIWGVANRVPNSLLEDSIIDLADAMAVEVAQAFAEAFDNAGFIGDGSNAYHGTTGIATKILQSAYSASVVTATSNDTFDDLTLKNFTDTLAKLPLYARRQAAWYVSPVGWGAAMLRLAMLPGGSSNAGGNTGDNVAAGFGEQFLGYPVRLVHSLESGLTGTTGKVACLFGDLSQSSTFGERRAINIRTASERYIELDQTLTFATSRVAIVAGHDLGSTTKAGPVVALKFG